MAEQTDDQLCSPNQWERNFYVRNDIPIWSGTVNSICNLGKIWTSQAGSYIEAQVKPSPEQFWMFQIYCSDTKLLTVINTQRGELESFFDIIKTIAEGKIIIESVVKDEGN